MGSKAFFFSKTHSVDLLKNPTLNSKADVFLVKHCVKENAVLLERAVEDAVICQLKLLDCKRNIHVHDGCLL